MIRVTPIPAFSDNYIWCIHDQKYCILVDPGEANPVLEFIDQNKLILKAILTTHKHADHTGGIAGILKHYDAPVFGPNHEAIPCVTQPLSEGNEITFTELALDLRVLDIPGHTLGHIAYVNETLLFCGDTLFGAGCGRVFEGTMPQMYGSLQKLAQLPEMTHVYCGHEYTLKNLAFAQHVEPNNPDITQRIEKVKKLREQSLPSLPSIIKEELLTNPFLRCEQANVIAYAEQVDKNATLASEIFTILRDTKDHF